MREKEKEKRGEGKCWERQEGRKRKSKQANISYVNNQLLLNQNSNLHQIKPMDEVFNQCTKSKQIK